MKTKAQILLVTLALLPTGACQSPGANAEESYIKTEDAALLHYRKIGSGPDVLLVIGDSLFGPDIDSLAEDRTVIFYDPRRRGRSGKASFARFEEDLTDITYVRSWLGLDRFSLLGFDYAAALAAHYAAQNPEHVEALVMVSPIPPRKNPYWDIYNRVFEDRTDGAAFERLRKLQAERADRLHPDVWAQAYKDAFFSGMVKDVRSLKHMKGTPLVEPNLDPAPLRRQYLGLLNALGDWDWRGDFEGIRCPTLVVLGESDPVPQGASKEWVESIPGARLANIGNSGRLPWIEERSAFESAVEDFLPR